MPLAHWVSFVSLFSTIGSVPLSSSDNSLLSKPDALYPLSPGAGGVHVVSGWTLNSKFVIGGWDPIFSTLRPPLNQPGSHLERSINARASTGIAVHCHAEQYGSPNRHSCGEAFVGIPNSKEKITFTERTGRGSWDYKGPQPLPFRWVSPLGGCVIEITNKDPSASDFSSGADLRIAAYKVISQCVNDRNQGGVITGLGDQGQLSVQVKAATPQVKCAAPPTKHDLRMRAYCQIVLNGMPTTSKAEMFGLDAFAPTVVLPVTFTDAWNRCNITIDRIGPPMLARWYDIWGAACSVMGICVQWFKDGTAFVEPRNSAQTNRMIVVKVQAGPGSYDSEIAIA